MKQLLPLIASILSIVVLSSCETSPASSGGGAGASEASATTVRPYPLSTCLVTGEDLNAKGGPITQVYQGQEVKFCCKPCQMAFKQNPDVYLAKIQ